MLDTEIAATNAANDTMDASFAQDLRLLADEAKTLAQAELAFQKSRAAYVAGETGKIAGLLVVAAVIVFFAVMALIVGTIIALGAAIGLWWAMLAVTLTLLVFAIVLALIARGRLRVMKQVSGNKGTS